MGPWTKHRRRSLAILVTIWFYVTFRMISFIPSVEIPDAVLTTRRLSRSEEHLQERSRGKDLHKNTRNEDPLLEQKNKEVKPEEILGTREVDSREEQQGKESNPEIKQKNESNPSEVQQNKETNPKIQENKEPNPFQEQQNKESNVSERQQNKESNPSEEQQNSKLNPPGEQENKESNPPAEQQNKESNPPAEQQNKESVPEIEQNKESKPTLLQGKIPSKVEELKIKETLTIKEDNKSLSQPKIISKIAKKKEGPDLSHNIDPSEISVRQDEISALKAKIERLNMEQRIFNTHRYGPVGPNTTILLVQVHKRLDYLEHLVESMKRVRGINKTLVIFSHDFWDDHINALVQNITEFRVMQMFFPYSLQLHPLTFPGRDPRDCEWNMPRNSDKDCLNKAWPDKYGHYREPQFTQIKHHWWWKINRAFDVLRVTRDWTGVILSLEEDHYLLPDTLHVLNLMLRQKPDLCPTCHVMGLGNYHLKKALPSRIFMTDWPVSGYNLGYTLDRYAWETIKELSDVFCTYDDYNWDLTLSYIVLQRITPHLGMLRVDLSRVAHIGKCGTHFKSETCNIEREIKKVNLRHDAKQLFPKNLSLHGDYSKLKGKSVPSGGWGDARDKQLCNFIFQEASGKNVTTMINTFKEDHR